MTKEESCRLLLEDNDILGAMSEACIFDLSNNNDGTFTIMECCDMYYSIDLSREELLRLSEQIKEIANREELDK